MYHTIPTARNYCRSLRLMSSRYTCGPYKVLAEQDRIDVKKGIELTEVVDFDDFLTPIVEVWYGLVWYAVLS